LILYIYYIIQVVHSDTFPVRGTEDVADIDEGPPGINLYQYEMYLALIALLSSITTFRDSAFGLASDIQTYI